jgi:hypothetical protein
MFETDFCGWEFRPVLAYATCNYHFMAAKVSLVQGLMQAPKAKGLPQRSVCFIAAYQRCDVLIGEEVCEG